MDRKKGVVIGQDKEYSGKLPKREVDSVIEKFEKMVEDNIIGYELNGGEGMTKGAQESWGKFEKRREDNDQFAIYNTNEEVERIKINLRNRVDNKNSNNN